MIPKLIQTETIESLEFLLTLFLTIISITVILFCYRRLYRINNDFFHDASGHISESSGKEITERKRDDEKMVGSGFSDPFISMEHPNKPTKAIQDVQSQKRFIVEFTHSK